MQCGTCVEECLRRYFMDEVLVVNAEDRVNRGTCVDLCPSGAIA